MRVGELGLQPGIARDQACRGLKSRNLLLTDGRVGRRIEVEGREPELLGPIRPPAFASKREPEGRRRHGPNDRSQPPKPQDVSIRVVGLAVSRGLRSGPPRCRPTAHNWAQRTVTITALAGICIPKSLKL